MSDLVTEALREARDTRALRLGEHAMAQTGAVFRLCFAEADALVVADVNTFKAAGRRVLDGLRADGVPVREPFVFDQPDLHATFERVQQLRKSLEGDSAVPVAVGSGTINDVVKLAAHQCNRSYMAVATAASMDGYTAYGASITHEGSKQTFFCPAPRAVIADMEVICAAPAELNAAGYSDLVAKIPAGADWILADALGIEAIDARAWRLVQDRLRDWIGNPGGIRRGDPRAIENLIEGLLMTGLAMQWCKSSRPASGAEHQFSHLWDMQNHRHLGHIPLHGCKVAIGALTSIMLYEQLLAWPMEALDIETLCAAWPDAAELERRICDRHEDPRLRSIARTEMQAKHIPRETLRTRLSGLRRQWPALGKRLREQLIPALELRQLLQEAGAPYHPAMIGISLDRLRASIAQAQQIRRRYTVLDLAAETGLLAVCADRLLGPAGLWTVPPWRDAAPC